MKGMGYRPISDMESNGVYFEPETLQTNTCAYSGLLSVEAYMEEEKEEEEVLLGHS